ncbi:MAG: hypothetical protein Q4D21_05045 [Phascolarctobacterium sp.]|nr:hypothetical protein [Phascolarctobacterium sp.]
MKKTLTKGLLLSLLALAIPTYALAGVQGTYNRDGSAQMSYARLQIKSLRTAGREPMVFGQLTGAIGSESSTPISYSYYTSFYQDNEKPDKYYGIIPDVGEMILTLSSDQQTANIKVSGKIPQYFAANYKYSFKEVEFSEFAAVELLKNAPSMLTGLKDDYVIDVQDNDTFWSIKTTVNGHKNSWFDVAKDFTTVNRTDVDPNVPVYTPDDSNGPEASEATNFGPNDCEHFLKEFLLSKVEFARMLNEGCKLRQIDFDSSGTIWQMYFVIGKEKPGDGFVIYENFSVGEDKEIHRLINDSYVKVN